MFQANCEMSIYLGGVLKVDFDGVEYTPDESGKITVTNVLMVNITTGDNHHFVMDKTFKEILTAYTSGRGVVFYWVSDTFYCGIGAIGENSEGYSIWLSIDTQFETDNEDGYPSALLS